MPFKAKACILNSCISPERASKRVYADINNYKCGKTDLHFDRLFEQVFGNTGNAVIGLAVSEALRKAGWSVEQNYHNIPDDLSDIAAMLAAGQVDIIFLCMQDFIRPDAELIWPQKFFSNLHRLLTIAQGRICILSLGANHTLKHDCSFEELLSDCSPLTINILDQIVESSMAIQVRDGRTLEGLKQRYSDRSICFLQEGCPSLLGELLPRKRLRDKMANLRRHGSKGKILVGGIFGSKNLSTIRRIYSIAQESYELDLDRHFFNPGLANTHPFHLQALSPVISANKVRAYFSPKLWRSVVRSMNFDYYVGTRLHGGIVSLMSGVPAVFTSGDARTLNFASQFCLPHSPAGLLVEDAMTKLIEWDLDRTLDTQTSKHNAFVRELKCLALSCKQ